MMLKKLPQVLRHRAAQLHPLQNCGVAQNNAFAGVVVSMASSTKYHPRRRFFGTARPSLTEDPDLRYDDNVMDKGISASRLKSSNKPRTSTKNFNLLGMSVEAKPLETLESVPESNLAKPLHHGNNGAAGIKRKKHVKRLRKTLDRASFRKLLEDSMATGNVSSMLRRYMDEYRIMDNEWSDQELVMITSALIKMNRSENALEVLQNQIKEPNRNRLNRVAAESARRGNAQVALGVLEISKHFQLQPDVIMYTSAIHACARGYRSDVPLALNLLDEMIQNGVVPNHRTYGAVVLAYARMNRWDEIQELMDTIPYMDEANMMDVFTSAIITCTRNRQYEYATRLFKMLLEGGSYPGDNVCNAALSACARTRDLQYLNVIFKLVEKHATPTIYSFNSMISAYGNARQVEEALGVYDNMSACDVAPDVVTFNALLLGAVRSRKLELVPDILAKMEQHGCKWDVYTLNMLLEGCALSKGNVKLAEQYWATATNQTKQDVRLDRTHFETMMGVYFAAGEYQKVIEFWKNDYMCRRRAKTSKTLNFLIRACKELKMHETAAALMDEFAARGHPISSVSHNHLLTTFLATDNIGLARDHLNRMVENEDIATTFSFTCLMKYLLKTGRAEDVLDMFEYYIEIRDKSRNPLLHYPADAIYVLTMRAAVQLGAHENVMDIYSAVPVAMSIAVKQELAKMVVDSCEKEEDWKGAVSLYGEISSQLDEEVNIELYNSVVKIVARAGEFEKALDVGGGEWYRQNRTDKGWGF